mmetsp:Transcript_17957/g.37824  ORF Transcript_17957/g.37824 Transcript_17957/m.37824 type:complete len:167 (+) Transcript_17957:667-1167(+)
MDSIDQPIDDYYQCDKHQLHILRAIALDSLGRSAEALRDWEKCVEFAVEKFPPVDETTIALRVQLALCARSLANEESIVKMEQAKKNKKKGRRNRKMVVVGLWMWTWTWRRLPEKMPRRHRGCMICYLGGIKRFLKRYEKEFLVKMRLRLDEELKKDVEALFGHAE